MIFGFNTDVKHGNTVYHVQSEARENSLLLQSTVFVQGRCLGMYTTSYAQHAALPSFSEEKMHELLKQQHRNVLQSIRDGNLSILTRAEGGTK